MPPSRGRTKLLTLVSLLPLLTLSQLSAKIYQSSTLVSSTSSHEVTVQFKGTDIPIGSFIILQYSGLWNLASVSGGNTTSDYCETGCSVSGVLVVVNNLAGTVQIKNLFPRLIAATQSRIVRYTLKTVSNPSYVTTENIVITLYDNTASILDLTSAQVSTTARPITCSSSRSSTLVSATADYQFTINPAPLTLPANLYIIMNFPSMWATSTASGTYSWPGSACSSTVNPLINCVQVNSNLNASNVLSASTSSAFSLTLTNILNPGSEQTNNQISFQFYTSGKQIAYCTVPITGTTAKTIPDFAISLAGAIGATVTAAASFTITEKVKTTDIVQFQIPKQYGCAKLYASFVFLNSETVGREATLNIDSTSSTTVTIITLQPFFSDSIALYTIKLFDIQLPKTTAAVGQIKLSIIRNGALVASHSCCANSYPLLTSTSGLSVTLSTSAVGSSSTHYLSLTSTTALSFPNDYSYLLIEFDSKYTLANPTYNCYISNSLTLVDPLTCTRSTATRLLISNFNSSARIGNTLFTIGIDSILTPITLSPLSLSLYTLDTNSNPIQKITTTYTLTATKINNVKVTPAVLTTYAITQYSFVITNTNALAPGAIAIFVFPPEIRVGAAAGCFVNGTQLAAANCVVDVSVQGAHKVTLSIGNAGTIGSSLLNQTTLAISQITNPLSLKQTSSLSIQLMTSLGQIIQQLQQGILVTLTTPASTFTSLSCSISDSYTMSASNYTFQFQLPVDIKSVYGSGSGYVTGGMWVTVGLPADMGCLAEGTAQPCMVSGETQALTYTVTTTAPTLQSFTVKSITNPAVITISSAPMLRLYLGGYLSIESAVPGLTSFQPSIVSYTLSQSNYYLSQKSNIFLTVTGISNWLSSTSSRTLRIAPPTQFTVDGSQAITCNQAGVAVGKVVSGGRLAEVTLAGVSSLVNLTVTISNMINPGSAPSTTKWSLTLLDTASSLTMASSLASTDPLFDLSCTLPCRSCQPANHSYCLSCYTAIATIVEKYLDTVGNTCVSACGSNQYLSLAVGDLQCYGCAASCATCANVSDNCTACSAPSGTYLYQATSKCVTKCPPQYYSNSITQKCTPCTSPCLYCTGPTGLTCTLCQPTYILTIYTNLTTTCTLTCPAGYYNHSNICTPCPTNCNTCTAVNRCTLCASGYLLYAGICVAVCPSGYYVKIAGGSTMCEACQLPCTTCTGFSTYCTTCDITEVNRYLVVSGASSTCTTGCPAQQYPNQNYICQPCISPCLLCTSPTSCISCTSGYYIYTATQSCHSICPTNTILIASPLSCSACTPPCLSCIGSVTSCSSCVQGYFLDTALNTCNLTCTLPFFAIKGKCSRCASPCATCAALQPYACTTCVAGYYLFGTTCYPTQCPDGSYRVSGTTCGACTSGCLTCITTSSTCLSCYPGLYLYQQACLPSCPTSPVLYYQYQMQCIACQPQCTSCISTPIECTSCSNPALYFNEVTRECTNSCTSPYYPGVSSTGQKLCIKCKLPCKTCTTTYQTCASCYNGLYLEGASCVQDCALSTFANTDTNTCDACSTYCLTCSSASSCTVCQASSYSYRGACYLACPAQAPYIYQSKYCRNCLLNNCLLCDSPTSAQPECLLCQPGYYLHEKKCVNSCPSGYEPDSVSTSLCITTEESALLGYLKVLEKMKVYLMPGSAALVVSLVFLLCYLCITGQATCCDPNSQYTKKAPRVLTENSLQCLLAIPQTVALLIYLLHLSLYSQAYYIPQLIHLAYYGVFAIFVVLNVATFVVMYQTVVRDKIFLEWRYQGNRGNWGRFWVIMAICLIWNRRIIYLLFSGIWRLPITCCQISGLAVQILGKRLKLFSILSMLLVQAPAIGYAIATLYLQNYLVNNQKLFYSTIDLCFTNLACILLTLATLPMTFTIPSPYRKYILEKVSNRSLAGFSQKIPEEVEDDDDLHLHRSNSTEGLKKESQEMKAVEYRSVFDPSDFEDPDFMEPVKIQNALNHGKFRKKNLKKKKKKGRQLELDIIDEDSDESVEAAKKPKKRAMGKKRQLGYMNNYIYWKPPQKVQKKKPEKQFKMHQKQIMQTIRQKQSDFDTITRNDIIFQEEPLGDNSSHDSDPNFELQDSRRALNYQYETFLNKNYAKRRHLG